MDLARIWDGIDVDLGQASWNQKHFFDLRNDKHTQFYAGQSVYKRIPTTSKISPHWERGWTIVRVKDKVAEIIKQTNGKRSTVSIDRIKPELKGEVIKHIVDGKWKPPDSERHLEIEVWEPVEVRSNQEEEPLDQSKRPKRLNVKLPLI
ncbi:hypothetical protein RF11_02877 [Thelohanellus kitauei]|uniref:Uncharacterized protein n=1 Tax=Thelohanellus kitauei TaxID=669202 RepID=A0A0C2IFL7_THEKT|nr:hypothetical protein RF11_02877 [Thelohanellus kitauei]